MFTKTLGANSFDWMPYKYFSYYSILIIDVICSTIFNINCICFKNGKINPWLFLLCVLCYAEWFFLTGKTIKTTEKALFFAK